MCVCVLWEQAGGDENMFNASAGKLLQLANFAYLQIGALMQAAELQFGLKIAKFRSGSGEQLKQSFNHVNICLQNLQVIYANAANNNSNETTTKKRKRVEKG